METSTIYAALAAFIAALIALAAYHLVVAGPALRRLRELSGVHDQLIGGGTSASARLARLDGNLEMVQTALERVTGRVGELEALARTDISRVGFVRYDAFDDTGSELSYAMALLNREGDGVVISSIYSRTDTRTYGKAVANYQPAVNASDEELLAITRARTAKA
ncbi:MAG TPA: DUF4446 family protein [Candidatus Baltobacteraceae bacterium]|nr:DUF4446 family protein [Candidatus Baltobacteraceae bacterium]